MRFSQASKLYIKGSRTPPRHRLPCHLARIAPYRLIPRTRNIKNNKDVPAKPDARTDAELHAACIVSLTGVPSVRLTVRAEHCRQGATLLAFVMLLHSPLYHRTSKLTERKQHLGFFRLMKRTFMLVGTAGCDSSMPFACSLSPRGAYYAYTLPSERGQLELREVLRGKSQCSDEQKRKWVYRSLLVSL